MRCENCGEELTDGERVCTFCGSIAVRSLMHDRSENVIGLEQQRNIERKTEKNNYSKPAVDEDTVYSGNDISRPFAAQSTGEYKFQRMGEAVIRADGQSRNEYVKKQTINKKEDSVFIPQNKSNGTEYSANYQQNSAYSFNNSPQMDRDGNGVGSHFQSTPIRSYEPNNSQGKKANLHSQYTPEGYIPPANLSMHDFFKLNELKECRNKILPAIVIVYIYCIVSLIAALINLSPLGLIDVAILSALNLGVQLKFSKKCAVGLCVYSVLRTLLLLVFAYFLTGETVIYGLAFAIVISESVASLVIFASVFAILGTSKFAKLWDYYQATGFIPHSELK